MAKGKKTGGRKAGTPNKISGSAREAFELAFLGIGGVPALTEWGKSNQGEFYKLYSRLISIGFHFGQNVTVSQSGGK